MSENIQQANQKVNSPKISIFKSPFLTGRRVKGLSGNGVLQNAKNTGQNGSPPPLAETWAKFLNPIFPDPGSWYVTLTFRDVIQRSTGKEIMIHPETANKHWLRLIHHLNQEIYGTRYYKHGQGVIWARGTEYQQRGAVHYHGLIGNVPDTVCRMDYVHWCWDQFGKAYIHKYDSKRGAVSYLTKASYSWKRGEIDLSDTIHQPGQRQLLVI